MRGDNDSGRRDGSQGSDTHVDPQALDDAITAQAFTGVATVDIADQRILERCSGFIHRSLRVPMPSSAQIAMGSGSTYQDVARRLVFEPAGLERTTFLPLNDLPADAAPDYVGETMTNEGLSEDVRAQCDGFANASRE